MKRVLLLICLISVNLNAQVEDISSVNVGAYVDHTIVPLSPQSNYSHSQVIYYKEQLEFRGYISEISYFTPFSSGTQTNIPVDPANLTIKFGLTDIDEFGGGNTFLPEAELTEMTGILRSRSVYEVRYTFETPFYYDGTQHLVVDVEDLNPAASQSATDGYRGVENFGNPPNRSIISLTSVFDDDTQETSVLVQNAYPQTKFYGDLERCALVYVGGFENVTANSADAELTFSDPVTTVRYNINEIGEEIPETYETTTESILPLSGLLPAQRYNVNVKSDCDEITSSYNNRLLLTRPTILTVPHTIDFEGAFERDYWMPSFDAEISAEGANDSGFGLVLQGPGYPLYLSWDDFGDPYQLDNQSFVRTVSFDVDLTPELSNPVLKFDIKQNFEAYMRVKIKAFGDDSYYTGIPEEFIYNAAFDDDEYKTVTYDLSDYVGEVVTIKLEHISSSFARKTFLDNIRLIENDCEKIENITSESALNSITLDWDATSGNSYDAVASRFEDYVSDDYLPAATNSYTFTDLESATAYKLFVRNDCESSESPWEKIYASTNPEFLDLGFDENFGDASLTNGKFSVLHSESSQVEVVTYFLSEAFSLFQRNSDVEWVGGDTTTEAQAWNDNKDFMTGLRFMIDGTSLTQGEVALSFKLQHHAVSVPQHSWFRVLINGTQVGPSYNPVTKNSDPATDITIDLAPYLGDIITFDLQQVGRYKGDFELSAISGDGTILRSLAFTGEALSIGEQNLTSLNVYPNPAHDVLTIEGLQGNTMITIFDLNGRQLTQGQSQNSIENVDVSGLANGVYFIQIRSGNASEIVKFIKH